MAGSSLFALLDDIATVLDDVSVMTKVAAKKTAGVLGDDLALNAQQVHGVKAERELPVVWAVAKGSALNKLILVPVALLLAAFIPALITPLLMLGGLYLCFEGVEKIWHSIAHRTQVAVEKEQLIKALHAPSVDLRAFESAKIKGAIRTDFILSAEIIVIALGTVAQQPFVTQAMVVSAIAFGITVGVYGLVAFIVKLDDIGLYFASKEEGSVVGKLSRGLGGAILAFCPWLMRGLSFFGTLAMFLVGGGIVIHSLPWLHHAIEGIGVNYEALIPSLLSNFIVGVAVGMVTLLLIRLSQLIYEQIATTEA